MAGAEDSTRLKGPNDQLSRFFKTRADYDRVTVLVIYWQECTNSGFKQEAIKIGSLMKTAFKYNVEYFEIPSDRSQLALDVRLNELFTANQQDRTLLIIHYGGHGEIDDVHDNQSVWAA
jgi:hypothetical protein